jgi:hypothetical protein
MSITAELPAATIARLQAKGWGPVRILSALGHPGYGAKFARRAVALIAEGNVSPYIAISGLIEMGD